MGRTGVVLAVVLLVTGAAGAYAVDKITSKQIAKSAIKSKHVKDNTLTGGDVKNGSLTANDFAGGLPAGERGPQGPAGEPGAPGTSVFADEIPSGETVYGTLGERMPLDAAGQTYRVAVSFPVPAPEILEDSDVSFAPGGDGEDDEACTGTSTAPTAPPGKVCLYTAGQSGNGALSGDGSGNNFGFIYTISSNGGNPDFVGVRGSWAYTAP
jgi:hypothetical protein